MIALALICALLTGCAAPAVPRATEGLREIEAPVLEFSGLSDAGLLTYVEDVVYEELVTELDSTAYFVENVSALYISSEYLAETAYHSRENVYFGYTLSELDACFQGARYVFTADENGQTTVQAFEAGTDPYDQVIRNVAVGAGVILVCVTVSLVGGAVGAPAVSVIFAASAKTGTAFALSSGLLGGAASGIVTFLETGSEEAALESAALAGSEGFKWGAISGALTGGIQQAAGLYGATANGLTMNEAAIIQQESKYPLSIIKEFRTMDEYQVYREAGLKARMVGGETVLVQDIDLDYVSTLSGSPVTNLQRMQMGYAPIDPASGTAYQLHHIGQKADATLAVLTEAQHQGSNSILHIIGKASEIDRAAFDQFRQQFWQYFAALAA